MNDKIEAIIFQWFNYLPEGIISSPIQLKTLAQAIATYITENYIPRDEEKIMEFLFSVQDDEGEYPDVRTIAKALCSRGKV